MSLLDDLQSLDLSGIINARASISLAVDNPQLQALLQGGAAQTVLGELGGSLGSLRASVANPAALIGPLANAFGELAEPLNLNRMDIDRYLAAVREGAEILTRLLADFDGNPASLGRVFGSSLGEALERVQSTFSDVAPVDLGEATRVRELINLVESGLPTSPEAFADVAVDILLPFPKASLRTVRDNIGGLLTRAAAITLPRTRTAQLTLRLNAVADAAATGNIGVVQRALRELNDVRVSTRASIENDLQAVVHLLNGLRVEDALRAVASVSDTLRVAEDGVLEFMTRLRVELAALRGEIDNVDPARIIAFIERVVDEFENQMRLTLGQAIDEQVNRLKAWVRSLLGHLPLRQLRAELTRVIHQAAQAIIDADLDRYAREVFSQLEDVRAKIDATNLGDQVRGALATVEQNITNVLDAVVSALQTVSTEINAVATQAREVLQRVVAALRNFQNTIHGIVDAVENLGVEAAAQQVIDTLASLRQTAEELLSVAPLPEPMRPLVEQLIATIRGVDVNVVFDPVRAAVSELAIPPDVESTITAALAKARDCLNNLIPQELIQSIQREVEAALGEIRKFDPSSLLSGVTGFINETAAFIAGLDPRPHVNAIRGPYLALLEAFDQAHPVRLLAPVTEAYDSLFGRINVPPPGDTARNIGQAVGTVGEHIARATVEPVRQMAPQGMVSVAEPNRPPPSDAELPSLEGARPGDVMRMFGYLPNKLREALRGLDTSAAQAVLGTLDGLVGGLAANLRRVRDELWAIDARLATDLDELLLPLGQAQLRAQVSLQANVSTSAGTASFNLDAALETVTQAGPGAMRAVLTTSINNARGRARQAAESAGGSLGGTLDRIAGLLDEVRIAGLLANVDDFLAALDPEPVAAEADALVLAVVNKTPSLFAAMETELKAVLDRAKRLLEEYNPGAQARKFLTVLDVLREELDLINPARLAAELGEIHAAIRETITAFDPALLAESVAETLTTIANNLRSLDPAALLGDLSFLDTILDRVEAASPVNALAGVGESLQEVGEQLAALNPGALLDAVQGLGARVLDAFQRAIEAIKQELITLLESLEYFTASASVSVEASVGR
jgi:hypothetical protein